MKTRRHHTQQAYSEVAELPFLTEALLAHPVRGSGRHRRWTGHVLRHARAPTTTEPIRWRILNKQKISKHHTLTQTPTHFITQSKVLLTAILHFAITQGRGLSSCFNLFDVGDIKGPCDLLIFAAARGKFSGVVVALATG